MSNIKRMMEKMADEGVKSFIVTYDYFTDDTETAEDGFGGTPNPDDVFKMQFWAENYCHAGEQFDDSEPDGRILLIENQSEYEARTGEVLNYGRLPNV